MASPPSSSRSEGKKIQAEAKSLGEKTPAEVESISVSTMRTSLESSQSQVKALQTEAAERETRHNKERQEWIDKAAMRAEFDAMESKLRAALDELLTQAAAQHGRTGLGSTPARLRLASTPLFTRFSLH